MLSAYLELLSDITGYQQTNCLILTGIFMAVYLMMTVNLVTSAFSSDEDTPTAG